MAVAGRSWHAVNALVVVVALAIQIPITASATGGRFDTPAERVANLFTFFTILTNVLVGATCAALAVARSAARGCSPCCAWTPSWASP